MNENNIRPEVMKKLKDIIKDHFSDYSLGLFFTRNMLGDPMYTLYHDENIVVDVCSSYAYFEVFGLNEAEQNEIEEYYNKLLESRHNYS